MILCDNKKLEQIFIKKRFNDLLLLLEIILQLLYARFETC